MESDRFRVAHAKLFINISIVGYIMTGPYYYNHNHNHIIILLFQNSDKVNISATVGANLFPISVKYFM